MVLGKYAHCLSDALFHAVLHDLLTLLLDDVVGVVLGELSVDRGGETHDRLLT